MGMGGLVGGKGVDKLKGGPAVVDLVKHSAVHIGFCLREHFLFVEELRVILCIYGKNDCAVRPLYHKFVKYGLVVRGNQAHISHVVIDVDPVPGKNRLRRRLTVNQDRKSVV